MSRGGVYWKANRDASEPEIMKAFREEGCSLTQLSAKGLPDLLVGCDGATHLVECKTNNAGLSKDQQEWQKAWAGEPVAIARNGPQAKALVRQWRAAAAVMAEARARVEYDPKRWNSTDGQPWPKAEP